MTEPLATVGAIAAVSQLTGELVKLTTNLRHHLKVMRRAPHEVQCFLMETSNFTCLLNSFTELAARPVRNMEKREQRKREKMISEVEQQCAYVRDKMEYLVDRFAMLAKEDMTPLGMCCFVYYFYLPLFNNMVLSTTLPFKSIFTSDITECPAL
ncbi:hypothetical protein F5Y01DRAFT_276637 [Xylaria sp. FL0043]|nr:hypothetical protein F5Y01DRAFT_276637 [Xylaria sp. FL0043]